MTSPQPQEPDVILHLGAHKTATTHLQRSLRENRSAYADRGVQVYTPKDLRRPGFTLSDLFGLPPHTGAANALRSAQEQFAVMLDGGHRLVLSEENYAGVLQNGWGKVDMPLYPQAPERVTALGAALGVSRVHICLGIRQPAAYLTSVYSQTLLGGRVLPLDKFREKNPLAGVDWSDYVARLRAAPGVGEVIVWRYEDYGAVFNQICAIMLGGDVAPHVRPLDWLVHPGLSVAAVTDVLARDAMGETGKLARRARDEWPVTPDNPPFDAFDRLDHARAGGLYARQVSRIGRMDGVHLLRP